MKLLEVAEGCLVSIRGNLIDYLGMWSVLWVMDCKLKRSILI